MHNDLQPRTSRWTTVIGILVAVISLGLCAAGGYLAWKRATSPKKGASASTSAKSNNTAQGLFSPLIRVQSRRSRFEGKPLPAGPAAPTQKKHIEECRAWQLRRTLESWHKAHPDTAADTPEERFITDAWHWLDQSSGATESAAIHKRARALADAGHRDPLLGMAVARVLRDEQPATVTLQMMKDTEKGLRDGKYPLLQLCYNQYYQAQLAWESEDQQAAGVLAGTALETLAQAVQEGEFIPDDTAMAYRISSYLAEYLQGEDIQSRIQVIFQKKKNIDPWLLDILAGQAEIEKAWAARTGVKAEKVTQQGWHGFELHLGLARNALLNAWRRRPERPQAAMLMIKVTLGGCGLPGVSERDWFDHAVAARFDYIPAYDALNMAMLPRWDGSHAAMLEFARECLNTCRFDTEVPYHYLQTLRDIGRDYTRGAWRAGFRQPGVAQDLERMFQGYLKDPGRAAERPLLLAQQAVVQAWCGNYARARELLKAVPADVNFQTPLFGQFITWGRVNRQSVEAELRAFTGPQQETLARAETLHLAGKVDEALELYTRALQAAKADPGVCAYLANKIGNIRMDDGEHYTETNHFGWTTLHRALLEKNDELSHFLIDHGVDLDAPDNGGQTPLLLAMAQEQLPMMDYLLDHGANPNLDPDKQTTPLNCAIMRKRQDIAERLIAKGANVNQISHGKWAPITQAIVTDNAPMLKLLLDKGANPNLHVGRKMAPLLRACSDGKVEMARLLLEKGADPNAAYKGFAALHYCADANQCDIARLLIAKGARLDAKTPAGRTPLDQARAKNNDPMIRLLETAGKRTK